MNPQPSVLETAALPVELHPYNGWPGGARTRDILLNRQALCRLSYRPIWWAGRDLNSQRVSPTDLQSAPLPVTGYRPMLAQPRGLEPPTRFPGHPLSRRAVYQLAYGCVCAAGKPVARGTACDSSFGDRGGTRTHNPQRSTDFRDRLAAITSLCHGEDGEEGETRTPKPPSGGQTD